MDVSEKEVLRLLGYGENRPKHDEVISWTIRELIDELSHRIHPKRVYGIWKADIRPPYAIIGDMSMHAPKFSNQLKGATQAALFAVTLGASADELMRRYSAANMEKAVVADAVLNAMLEAHCDEIEREIAKSEKVSGLCALTRFSPGYGDFDIGYQADILRVLNAGKRIGLALTNGMMLAPTKSVVAVIGFGRGMKNSGDKCDKCENMDCAYRM